jgi:rubrerythrin
MGDENAEKERMIRILNKGLAKELEAIKFYLDNLEHFNYKENKKAVNELILESYDHAKWVTEELLREREDESGPIPSKLLEAAMEEERGMREIYEFEMNRCEEGTCKRMLQKLIKEEERHEKLVQNLK